ncbi:hypothetical protein AC578_1741 [Pseudocercospora eumusae]|uniref:Uncharacterized protein n=1 Tax=Pseudocercospora eumusae TaxID=321146 RepID=A0A139GT76_9PEZI|nr:hypothetical protein AC578_1741 [Pseudocercospora eumusae]
MKSSPLKKLKLIPNIKTRYAPRKITIASVVKNVAGLVKFVLNLLAKGSPLSIGAANVPFPVIFLRCFAFQNSKIGLKVSGSNIRAITNPEPPNANPIHSVHLQSVPAS